MTEEHSAQESSLLDQALVGVDVLVRRDERPARQLTQQLAALAGPHLHFRLITSPVASAHAGGELTGLSPYWRCRFVSVAVRAPVLASPEPGLHFADVLALLQRLAEEQVYVIKTEHLYRTSGKQAFFPDPGREYKHSNQPLSDGK
ncbi:hypothetical protein [Hymenobacter cellulosilyticus]|uniref:Isocitrate dehydrogenase/Hypothetical protein TT1725 C-terminal domain-containing protein n=1 Tax=Hymenobacter cellulosilyticus TaxID=2932248 RepID=A0A8T9QDC8_9BACT|nr:hypothetical protein [Hymenobacter cellulosilyticus]UOQ74912.1 hypothetical protein MUN79_14205 [Hymenobacter cellulosilyticus]